MRKLIKKSDLVARINELDPSHDDEDGDDSEAEEMDDQTIDSQYLGTIRKMLSFVGMDVKTVSDEWSGETYYCIVNTVSDILAKDFTNFEQWELGLFKEIVRKICTQGNSKLSIDDFLSEGRKVIPKVKDDQIRSLLVKLKSTGWIFFIMTEKALRLGPRVFVELAPLLDEFKCPVCPMCSVHIVRGFRPCNTCSIVAHKHCVDEHRENAITAPCLEKGCKGNWKKGNGGDNE